MKPSSSSLRITQIDIYRFPIKMRAPFRIATMVADHAPNMLVGIRTDAGITGWGEASPLHSISGETQGITVAAALELRQLILGRNPLEIETLVHEMDRFLPYNATAKSAFDCALYDIAAQAAGMPLYRFLGGCQRVMETDITLGIGNPATAGKEAAALLELGPGILKVKLGVGLEPDRERLAAIRAAVGDDVPIRIDANQGYDRATAIRALKAFAEFDIEFCEQPVRAHDLAGLAAVSHASPIPVMADEALFQPSDALRIAASDAAPMFNIKLSKSGGIHNALKIAAIAESAGIRCMVGCMLESRLGLAAAAHFACSTGAVQFYDLDTCFEQAENPIEGGVRFDGGRVIVPDIPGIGATPSREALARLEKAA